MANPILPSWEYIPDGEPRVFGNRVYLYGSHDRAYGDDFCDFKLKVWSAPIDNLNEWVFLASPKYSKMQNAFPKVAAGNSSFLHVSPA